MNECNLKYGAKLLHITEESNTLLNLIATNHVIEMYSNLITITINYNEIIKTSPVVLVEFYASWCPHCQRMTPIVDQVKSQLQNRVPLYQYDIDKNEAESTEADIQSVPTFIIYSNGVEKWRHSGEIESKDLLKKVEEYM
ncbi:thioredoxin [Alistipes sp. Z76]|nr:thioredoxin [Alistipes sp. Z76]